MDGDGRWARQRGLVRTEGHKEGESSLLDVIMGDRDKLTSFAA
jgi:undecaprenyl diphosphate synthase